MIRRAWQIVSVAARYRLDTLLTPERLETISAPWWLRLLLKLNPAQLRSTDGKSDGERLKDALVALGPVYIKLGQLLSTRPDIVPADLVAELRALQDNVPPLADGEAVALIEQALGDDLNAVFADLSAAPLAAASIAQVHAGTLVTGEPVVAKVVRPGLDVLIDQDLRFLRALAEQVEGRSAFGRRLHLSEVLRDYEQTIKAELNMLQEADNTTRLREHFANSELLKVPRVYAAHCRPNLLVMERVEGVPVSDVETLNARGVDLELLAARGVETFFTQVFKNNFFHADMHPGNVLVDTSEPANPRYIALDCAIMGSLGPGDQHYLAENLLAFFHRDYGRIAALHLRSGWIPPDTDALAFEAVIRQVCEPIFAKPLAEISFGDFIVQLFQTAQQFGMEVQPQLILLQKTLLYIEGLGRTLYPSLDLWTTAQPFMQAWMLERSGPVGALNRLSARSPELMEALPRLPEVLLALPATLDQLTASQRRSETQLAELSRQLEGQQRRRLRSRRAALFLIAAGALLLVANGLSDNTLVPPEIAVLAAVAGSAILLRA